MLLIGASLHLVEINWFEVRFSEVQLEIEFVGKWACSRN